ncbi:hypothetical protein [Streptomyces sp. NPDC057002]|uniref:hypothetical protein n=1 Tax=Streptomyces sp. NPDC057002 TaxID=3345992 RepID=UPI0036370369
MTNPPGPTPPAKTMPAAHLTGLVLAVQDDPQGLPAAIRGRVASSRQDGHLLMMGGWTDSQ